MSTTDPDTIRADIERTRASLSDDVNALAYEVNPKTVMRRKTRKVTGAFGSLKDSVMGTASSAQDAAGGAAHAVGEAASNAPAEVTRQTRGNPLAAGLVAFGVGALVASLLPATDRERALAADAKDKAQPLVEETKQIAQESAQNLKQPAQEAVESVKQTATEAASTVKDEGQSAARDVRQEAQQ
jgi:ElaB/YqjD/DUF883 family membrane-anchored ribosome-binding protein